MSKRCVIGATHAARALGGFESVPVLERKPIKAVTLEPTLKNEAAVVVDPFPRITFQDVASARLYFERTGETLPILESLAV